MNMTQVNGEHRLRERRRDVRHRGRHAEFFAYATNMLTSQREDRHAHVSAQRDVREASNTTPMPRRASRAGATTSCTSARTACSRTTWCRQVTAIVLEPDLADLRIDYRSPVALETARVRDRPHQQRWRDWCRRTDLRDRTLHRSSASELSWTDHGAHLHVARRSQRRESARARRHTRRGAASHVRAITLQKNPA